MNVFPIPMIVPQALSIESEKTVSGGDKTFGEVLAGALKDVNEAQLRADEVTKKFLIGEIQDIHQVTIASNQAKLMLQLAVEVRNKAVEAYQEISRMQV